MLSCNTNLTVTEREWERSDNKNTTVTKADLSPQSIAQLSKKLNGKERIKIQIAVIRNNILPQKQIAGLGNTKAAR